MIDEYIYGMYVEYGFFRVCLIFSHLFLHHQTTDNIQSILQIEIQINNN